ncbi:MAG: FG-GAP-like repeat-containing protein [Candidatus Helarchaeota archaeon]
MPKGLEVESHDDKWTVFGDRAKEAENIEELFIRYFEWYLWDCAADDLNGDGKAEVVGASEDSMLRVVNGKNEELWSKQFYRAVFFCKIADIDKDGKNEVICGGVQGSVFVYDGEGTLKWEKNIGKWVYDVTTADIMGNGKLEIIAVSRDKTLRLIDCEGNELWQAKFPRYVRNSNFGDINGDGKLEVIGSDTDQIMKVFDGQGNQLWEFQFELKPPDPNIEVRSNVQIATGDLTGDGKDEIIAGSEDAFLRVFNGEGKELWNHKFEGAIHTIIATDLKGDGKLEVIVGAEAELDSEGKATPDTKNLIVFDNTGKILWHRNFDGAVFCSIVGDVNNDGKPELVIGTQTSFVGIFDQDGKDLGHYKFDNFVRKLALGDIDGDGQLEIIGASRDKTLRALKYKK